MQAEPTAQPDEGPPPHLRYRRALHLRAALRSLWKVRGVVLSLAERELRARYSQAFLGFLWALVAPVTLMVVFTVLFSRVTKVDTDGVPYPLFSYLGLVPWTFFSGAVAAGGVSIVTNQALLNKVYAPREVFPLASVATSAVDAVCASLALIILFSAHGRAPRATSFWVPVPLLLLLVVTVAITLLFAGLVVYVRDIRNALPLILQLGLFLTPVVYGLDELDPPLRGVYASLNPVATAIDGLRRAVLYGDAPRWGYTAAAAGTSVVMLGVAYVTFKRLETGFADVA